MTERDEREYVAREITVADEIICNGVQTLCQLFFEEMKPPAFAMVVVAKLGMLIGSHDGTLTEESWEDIKKLIMATMEANYRQARLMQTGQLPQSGKELN